MKITKLYVEYQEMPLGIDEVKPAISWKMEGMQQGARQSAYQLKIIETNRWKAGKTEAADSETVVWDTGKQLSAVSTGIRYAGAPLRACTRYRVLLCVWDEQGMCAKKESWFETGLMNPKQEAWHGAEWIAALDFTVSARTRGVFRIETSFQMKEDTTRAGIIFGANDERLLNASLNEYGIAGENFIRYEVNFKEEEAPVLDIYRVGYAVNDSADAPFASVALKKNIKKEEFHRLAVEVTGNCASAWIDGELADKRRVLNPRGENDVLTYPRMNEIGFFVEPDGKAYFKNLMVSNLREPKAVFVDERPEKHTKAFDLLDVSEGCFVLKGGQFTVDVSRNSIPMMRRKFVLKQKPVCARLYMTARGIYEPFLNGTAIGNQLLAPGVTQYDRRLHYQTYDVTEILQNGANALGVILSSGWWCDAQTFTVDNYNYFGDKEALLCMLAVEYADGSAEYVVSSTENWECISDGPYLYAGLFQGETFDARKEWMIKEFSKAGFSWETSKPVVYKPSVIPARNVGFAREWPEVNKHSPDLFGGYNAPVQIVEKRRAVKRVHLGEREILYDFGQEMAGVPELTFHEKAGTRILIRYGEMQYPKLPRYSGNVGKLMRENYRDAESTDIYICRGDQNGETYRPRFTFHGFRYVELDGITTCPELSEVNALQYSSVSEFTGSFQCSDELLNRFAENVRWSQLCNFISIPTDCPQRNERMGWAGDTHVFCPTALKNAHLKLFYERNLQAMEDLQEENGRYPEIAPIGGGFGGITYECASIFMAWELYQQYNDLATLERFYPGMKRYMDYMKKAGLPGRGNEAVLGPLADWLAFEETDPQLMWNAFYYREADLMEKIAGVLGRKKEQMEYKVLKEEIRMVWNRTFVFEAHKEADYGKTCTIDGKICDTQTSYAIGIAYGVAENPAGMAKHLVRKVKEKEYCVGTGFFGTGLLNKALSEYGYEEAAYKMLLQTKFPSWLYPVTQGATTIWEHWDSYTEENGFGEYNSMNSFNHYSLGSVLLWIYETVLGIQRQEEYPGYQHFILRPCMKMLKFAKGSIDSPYGKIESSWEIQGEEICYRCSIPANTSCTLYLPGRNLEELEAGQHERRIRKDAK